MAQPSCSRDLQMNHGLSKFYFLGLLSTLNSIVGGVDFLEKKQDSVSVELSDRPLFPAYVDSFDTVVERMQRPLNTPFLFLARLFSVLATCSYRQFIFVPPTVFRPLYI